MVLALQSQMKTLEQKYQFLIEKFRLAQHQRFGRSNEAHPAQPDLFNEAETEVDVVEEVPEEKITYTRKKPVRKSYQKTYLAKSLSTILMKLTKLVIVVAKRCTAWVKSVVKS